MYSIYVYIRRPHRIGVIVSSYALHIPYPYSHTHNLTISYAHILYLIAREEFQ